MTTQKESSKEPNWYFSQEELNNVPSVVGQNAITRQKELEYRQTTGAFIQEAGMKLAMPQLAIATALVYFHRFYVRHRFQDYDRFMVATACLFLSGKVEETPKKLRDVILVTDSIHNKHRRLDPEGDEFHQIKDKVLHLERILLQTINFDMRVEHPYKYLLNDVKSIGGSKEVAQTAWNFVNDSFRTTLCLQYKPSAIAAAAIFLAYKFLKQQLPEEPKPWNEIIGCSRTTTEKISNQILDLYQSSSSPGPSVGSPASSTSNLQPRAKFVPFQVEESTSSTIVEVKTEIKEEK